MRLVIFGPQGAGKGTQGNRISERFQIPAIATGDIFRGAISANTTLGKQAEAYVSRGDLVPDELTIALIRERLSRPDTDSGWLLDGFPRTIAQARALDQMLADGGVELDAAILLEVPKDVCLRRIVGRLICGQCGWNYHVDAPPKNDLICDNCGGKVAVRSDDQDEQAVRRRLENYERETRPLAQYYDDKGLLRRIDGSGTPEETFAGITSVLSDVAA